MSIRQGDVYWTDFPDLGGSEPSGSRPAVIIQGDHVNRSRIATCIVCPITSNLVREHSVGNVRLAKREANLPRPSVVIVSQISTVDRSRLLELIGTLSPARVDEIIVGINLILAST